MSESCPMSQDPKRSRSRKRGGGRKWRGLILAALLLLVFVVAFCVATGREIPSVLAQIFGLLVNAFLGV